MHQLELLDSVTVTLPDIEKWLIDVAGFNDLTPTSRALKYAKSYDVVGKIKAFKLKGEIEINFEKT